MSKKQTNTKMVDATQAGLEKFRRYAVPRRIELDEKTYSIRSVTHRNKTSRLEVINASCNGKNGWVVNIANRQRKFVTTDDGYFVSSKVE